MNIANCPDGGHCQNDHVIEALLAACEMALIIYRFQRKQLDYDDRGYAMWTEHIDKLEAAIAAAKLEEVSDVST